MTTNPRDRRGRCRASGRSCTDIGTRGRAGCAGTHPAPVGSSSRAARRRASMQTYDAFAARQYRRRPLAVPRERDHRAPSASPPPPPLATLAEAYDVYVNLARTGLWFDVGREQDRASGGSGVSVPGASPTPRGGGPVQGDDDAPTAANRTSASRPSSNPRTTPASTTTTASRADGVAHVVRRPCRLDHRLRLGRAG